MEAVWFLPKRAVPCQPKHVDVIADKHDVPNLCHGFGLSLPLYFGDSFVDLSRRATLFGTILSGLEIWDHVFTVSGTVG